MLQRSRRLPSFTVWKIRVPRFSRALSSDRWVISWLSCYRRYSLLRLLEWSPYATSLYDTVWKDENDLRKRFTDVFKTSPSKPRSWYSESLIEVQMVVINDLYARRSHHVKRYHICPADFFTLANTDFTPALVSLSSLKITDQLPRCRVSRLRGCLSDLYVENALYLTSTISLETETS